MQHASNNEALTALRERLTNRLFELHRLEDFANGENESQLQHKLWEKYNNAKNHVYNMRDRLEILPDARFDSLNEADIPDVLKVVEKRKSADGSRRKQFVAILNGDAVNAKPRHQKRNKETKTAKNEQQP